MIERALAAYRQAWRQDDRTTILETLSDDGVEPHLLDRDCPVRENAVADVVLVSRLLTMLSGRAPASAGSYQSPRG
jgi:hypothetical protein